MADEWKTVPLSDLYDFSSGLSKPRSEFGFGHGFLAFKDVLDNYFAPDQLSALVNSTEREQATCSIKRGDVFLTRTSETQPELGMSCVALKDYPKATFNGFTKRLRPKSPDEVVPEYAAYYFRGPRFRQAVTSMSSLSTRASLNNEMLSRLSIILPPVSEQKAIGIVLKALDDKIELNRRMNRTLEGLARALFQSWFVDFDPVRAKAAELVREGVLEIGDGYRAKNSELAEVGLPFVRAGNLNGGFDLAGAELLCEDSVAKAGNKLSRVGDVAFTSKGTVGRIARVNAGTPTFVYSPQVCFWRSLSPRRLHPAVLYCWMASPDFQAQIAAFSHQTDMAPYVSLRDQRQLGVPVFPSSQFQIGERIEAQLARQAHNHAQSRTLAALRDALLSKLISGELRVPDAERIVGRCV